MILTAFERAGLESIAAQLRGSQPQIDQQIATIEVVGRKNTGGGFFTDIKVNRGDAKPLAISPESYEAFVDISGMSHPLGFILFAEDGYLNLIEGYALAGEDTKSIDFETVSFGPFGSWPLTWQKDT